MKTKRLLCPQRLRTVPHQFSWIDQRLVREWAAMADVTVSEQTVVYPAKTARKGFAHAPGIDESFDRHCPKSCSLKVDVLAKSRPL